MNYVFIIFSRIPNIRGTLCNIKYGLKELNAACGTSHFDIWHLPNPCQLEATWQNSLTLDILLEKRSSKMHAQHHHILKPNDYRSFPMWFTAISLFPQRTGKCWHMLLHSLNSCVNMGNTGEVYTNSKDAWFQANYRLPKNSECCQNLIHIKGQ